MGPPVFYYDVSSPYAYLAAARVDDVLPVRPLWQPISFGFVLRATGRVPWSLSEGRDARFQEIADRAAARGLPPIHYPEGWPRDSYSLLPLRAIVFAARAGRERELTMALFSVMFRDGLPLNDARRIIEAAVGVGLDPDEVDGALDDEQVKRDLAASTNAAIAAGVVGVPSLAVDGEIFWGDDRLEDAAEALAGSD
jgi:2-hydroxychromene-2-carboxylate isomerase